jgi:hypothetical protein
MAKDLNPEDVRRRVVETAEIVEDALRNISSQISDIFKEALDTTSTFSKTITGDITKGINNLARTSTTLLSNQERLKAGNLTRAQIEKQIFDRTVKVATIQQQINIAKNAGLITDEAANEQLSQALAYENEFVADLKEQAKLADQFNKKLGATGTIIKGINKIPVLGGLIDSETVLARVQKKTAEEGATKFSVFNEGIKGIGSSIAKNLIDPLAIITSIIKVAKFFVEAMFEADKRITALSRNLQISKEEAQGVDSYFKSIKGSLETQFKLTKEIYQAQSELSELSALSNLYSKEALDTQIILTKELKLSSDEASNLNKIFEVNNEKNTDALDNAYETVAQYANQNKYLFSAQKILSQASKTSGQLLISFKGSSKALFEAALEANKLGTTLEKTKGISDSLLNFEESISAELEAELLTGKDLNLDRARALALQGDYVEATKAALENIGGLAEFQKLLPIQQRALAKAIGMTGDELADVLVQEQLILNNQKEQYNRFKEAGQDRLAQKLAEGKLTEADIKSANTRLDAQEKFNLALDQAKEIFTDLVNGGVLDKIATSLKALADALSEGGSIFSLPERFEKALEKQKEKEAKQIIGAFNERVKTEGIEKSDLSPEELAKLEEAENFFKRRKAVAENYNKKYKSEEKRAVVNTALAGGGFAMSGFLGDIIDKQAVKEGVIPVKDYVIKSLPEDTVVGAGGTKLGRTDEMVALLEKILMVSNNQPKIYLGTTELNTATAMNTYALNEGVTS